MSNAVTVAVMLMLSLAAGAFLYVRFGEKSDTLDALVRTLVPLFWISSGMALLIGGFTIIGSVIITFFFFLQLGAASDLKESSGDLRRELNG